MMLRKIIRRIIVILEAYMNRDLAAQQEEDILQISEEEIAEIKQFFPMDKYFVFGHSRSGTTLLIRLIRLHSEVHGNYQSHFFTNPPLLREMVSDYQIRAWLTRNSNRWNRGEDPAPSVVRAVADFLMERDAKRVGKNIVGDKSPNVHFGGESVRELYKIYPEARLIYIIRDGRDTILSHRIRRYIQYIENLSREEVKIRQQFIEDPERFYKGELSIFPLADFKFVVDRWTKNVNETIEIGRALYGDRFLVVRFEDLLTDSFEAVSRIWRFLGVDPEGFEDVVLDELKENIDRDWQKEKAGEAIALLGRKRIGAWKDLFTDRDKEIFKEIAGEILIEWGYEKDMEW